MTNLPPSLHLLTHFIFYSGLLSCVFDSENFQVSLEHNIPQDASENEEQFDISCHYDRLWYHVRYL